MGEPRAGCEDTCSSMVGVFLTASGAYVQLNSGRARRYGFAPIAHSKSRLLADKKGRGEEISRQLQ